MSEKINLGDVMERLYAVIAARKGGDPTSSYTAKLLNDGAPRCAKKFGEEAVEAALAGALGDREELANEAADTLYHLMVLMAAIDVTPTDVAGVLAGREGVSGLEEKASR